MNICMNFRQLYEESSLPRVGKVFVCIGFSRVFNNEILTFQRQSDGSLVTENDIQGWTEGNPKYSDGNDYVYTFFDGTENSGKVFNYISSGCFYECEDDRPTTTIPPPTSITPVRPHMDWTDANDYCKEKGLGGLWSSDPRLLTVEGRLLVFI